MKTILDKYQLNITIQRLSHQLMENHEDFSNSVLIGLQPRGVFLADKIIDKLKNSNDGYVVQYGKLDITFYRDDIRKHLHVPTLTNISFSIEEKKVILEELKEWKDDPYQHCEDELLRNSFSASRKKELIIGNEEKINGFSIGPVILSGSFA